MKSFFHLLNFKNVLNYLMFTFPIGLTLRDFIGFIIKVEGISMQPTLNTNPSQSDYIFISTWAMRNIKIDRGEIVSLTQPGDPKSNIIKRVIGVDGDIMSSLGHSNEKDYFEIPRGHCWVEGDQHHSSFDSNSFGPVAIGLINGKAIYIVWPPKRWQRLTKDIPIENSQSTYKLMI